MAVLVAAVITAALTGLANADCATSAGTAASRPNRTCKALSSWGTSSPASVAPFACPTPIIRRDGQQASVEQRKDLPARCRAGAPGALVTPTEPPVGAGIQPSR